MLNFYKKKKTRQGKSKQNEWVGYMRYTISLNWHSNLQKKNVKLNSEAKTSSLEKSAIQKQTELSGLPFEFRYLQRNV